MIIDGYTTPGTQRETVLSATDLLQQMDNVGVERAVIAPEDREIAVDHESGNNRMITMARNSANRLIAACSVSPWHADAPKKLVAAADRGAKMLVLAPMLQGFIPADDLVRPLLEQVGEGGMSVVYRAQHLKMDSIVAVKVLSRKLMQDDPFVLEIPRNFVEKAEEN